MRKIYQISLAVIVCFFCLTKTNAQRKIGEKVITPRISSILSNSIFSPLGTTADCDSLNLPLPSSWNPTAYYASEGGAIVGLLAGCNAYGDKQKASYFDISTTSYTYITGVGIYFAVANSNNASSLTKKVIFRVYNDVNKQPGTQIGTSVEVPLSQIKNDVDNGNSTEIKFPSGIELPANKKFYVSVDISNFVWESGVTEDSISLYMTSQNDLVANSAFEQWSDNRWFTFKSAWGFNAALLIHPYVSTSALGCDALPVKFLSFDGAAKDSKVSLNWSTGSELNNKGFDIERSTDGNNFSAIGFVKGNGTTGGNSNYTFTDGSKFLGGEMYYRLKQIDLDGTSAYSSVIKVNIENKFKWDVYPNPVDKYTSLQVQLEKNAKVTIQLVSANGKILQAVDKGLLVPGTYSVPLNLSTAAKGVYFVKMVVDGKTYTKTIVK